MAADDAHDPAQDAETLSVQVANQLINVANKRLEDGLPPEVIAAGMRHAAANFSAFVAAHAGDEITSEVLGDEFVQVFEYYLERHRPQQTAGHGLSSLIDQAKDGW